MKACHLKRKPEGGGKKVPSDDFTRIMLIPLDDPSQLSDLIGREDEEKAGWFCENVFLEGKHEGKALVHLVYRRKAGQDEHAAAAAV